MKGAKNSLNGGYNVERASAAHLHPLPFLGHPFPQPHYNGSSISTTPFFELSISTLHHSWDLISTTPSKKITHHTPHSWANMSTTISKILRKRGKINVFAHIELWFFGKNSAPLILHVHCSLNFCEIWKIYLKFISIPPFFGLSIIQVGLHPTP